MKPSRGLSSIALIALALIVSWSCITFADTNSHEVQKLGDNTTCASCHTDSQPIISLKLEDTENDIEPTPPPFWTQPTLSLSLLYTFIPIIFLGYIPLLHKILLTTRMRF